MTQSASMQDRWAIDEELAAEFPTEFLDEPEAAPEPGSKGAKE